MARLITFSEAQTRFANLATTGISIEDAIQEAVDSIYESGRWPGTTVEVPIASTDFELDETERFYLLKMDEATYDGMVGFRSENRGYSIVDQSMLYRDGTPGGGLNIVDLGTSLVDAIQLVTIVSGSGTASGGQERNLAGKVLKYAGLNTIDGNQMYLWSESGVSQVEDENPLEEGETYCMYSLYQVIPDYYKAYIGIKLENENFEFQLSSGEEFGNDPSLFDWSNAVFIDGASGDSLELTNTSTTATQERTYRMPYGFNPEMGPYWALMKKEPPQLTANDYIPINSVRALKYAILAICYEYVNDDGRATTYWSLFERAMQSATRQTNGPKNYFVGVKNTMSVKPTQFQ